MKEMTNIRFKMISRFFYMMTNIKFFFLNRFFQEEIEKIKHPHVPWAFENENRSVFDRNKR